MPNLDAHIGGVIIHSHQQQQAAGKKKYC